MGTLNIIISDDLDERFRLEVAKRLGMKKGNLTKALEEAIGLWIENPIAEKLKDIATNKNFESGEREKATELLSDFGRMAIPALLEIAGDVKLDSTQREKALELIRKITTKKKGALKAVSPPWRKNIPVV